MKYKLSKLIRSTFVRNVFIMATGAAGAQAITMALSPLITRLYGPEAYGLMGTFTSLTRIIIPIAALTYPIAIVLPKSDQDSKGLIKLSMYLTLIISVITTVILVLFNERIINVFNMEEIAPFLFLIPIVIIFAGLLQVSEQWLIRTKQFKINAKVTFYQSIIINGTKAGLGFIYPAAFILVVLQVLSNGLKAIMMSVFAKKTDGVGLNFKFSSESSLIRLAKKYKDFPIYRAPQVLLGAISDSLPILLLSSLFGPASAGFYSIGRTVLGLPSMLIGQSIGDVFYPRISEAANNGEKVSNLIKKASLALVGIGVVPFGLIIIFGPWLFEFVFGGGWYVAGEYARWIAFSSFAIFINKPAVRSMPVLNAQRFHLVYTVVFVLIRILALLTGFFIFKSDIVAVALFGISSALLNICLFLVAIYLGGKLNK